MLFKVHVDFDEEVAASLECDPRLTFHFIELPKGSRVFVKQQFIASIYRLVDEDPQYFHASCITKATDASNRPLEESYTNYFVLFFTEKENSVKRGILVTVNRDRQAMVSAAWPMWFRDECIKQPKRLGELMQGLLSPGKFENVNLLTAAGG